MTDDARNGNVPTGVKNLRATAIIEDRLYYVVMKTRCKAFLKDVDKMPNVHILDHSFGYEPFYEDFGPLNLAQVYKYCNLLNNLLKEKEKKVQIWQIVEFELKKRVNTAFLMGCFMILKMNLDAVDAYLKLVRNSSYIGFRDASTGPAQYTIPLLDCLKAVQKAKNFRFFDLKDFSVGDYEFYETVQNGDLNWIIPEKILAFAGPMEPDSIEAQAAISNYHEPSFYRDYFKALGVTTIIRLNHPTYQATEFEKMGIKVYTMAYPDGGVPDYHLARMFLGVVEGRPGAIAIHCKAGLGRTGTMIGLYLMKWYKFTALEAIAWLRICRPASVIGQQQTYLIDEEENMWSEGSSCRAPKHELGVYSRERGTFIPNKEALGDSLGGITSQVTSMDLNMKYPAYLERFATQGAKLRKIKTDRERTSGLVRRRTVSDEPICDSNDNDKNGQKQTAGGKIQAKKLSIRKRNSPPIKDEKDFDLNSRRKSHRLFESRKKSPTVR